MASQLPILEAVETLSSYYAIIVLAAIIMSVFLSYLVSRIVTRPLLRINTIAGQMADLDFSNYIEVRTDDENWSFVAKSQYFVHESSKQYGRTEVGQCSTSKDIEKERRLETMRREFISGASHELKTPIGIIQGFAEGIKDGLAQGKTDYFVDVILEEADKMDALVKDMLDLSRIEHDPNSLDLEIFECGAFVRSICEKLEPQIIERGMDLKLSVELDPTLVYADRRRMEQVLTNGLNNAMRYSYEGSTIQVKLSEGRQAVRITIVNPGDPIPEDHLAHVWDRFYRVDPSRSKASGGSGTRFVNCA